MSAYPLSVFLDLVQPLIHVEEEPKGDILTEGKLSFVFARHSDTSLHFGNTSSQQREKFNVEVILTTQDNTCIELIFLCIDVPEKGNQWYCVNPFYIFSVYMRDEWPPRGMDRLLLPQKRNRVTLDGPNSKVPKLDETQNSQDSATSLSESEIDKDKNTSSGESTSCDSFFITFKDTTSLFFSGLSKENELPEIFKRVKKALVSTNFSSEIFYKAVAEYHTVVTEDHEQDSGKLVNIINDYYSRRKQFLKKIHEITRFSDSERISSLMKDYPEILLTKERERMRNTINTIQTDIQSKMEDVKLGLFSNRTKSQNTNTHPAVRKLSEMENMYNTLWEAEMRLSLLPHKI